MLTLQDFIGNDPLARGLRQRVLNVYKRVMPEIRWPATENMALNNGDYSFSLFQDLPIQTRERITRGFRAGRLPAFNPNAPLEDDGNTLRVAVAEGILYDLLDFGVFPEIEDREQQREQEVRDLVGGIMNNVVNNEEPQGDWAEMIDDLLGGPLSDDEDNIEDAYEYLSQQMTYEAIEDAIMDLAEEDDNVVADLVRNVFQNVINNPDEVIRGEPTLPNVPPPAINYAYGASPIPINSDIGGNQGGGINVNMSNFQQTLYESDAFGSGLSTAQKRQRIRKFWKKLDQRIIKHPDRKIPKLVDVIRVAANKYII